MLLDGHHLNGVVAVLDDAWQHVVLEFGVGAHLLGILRHTDVALIDEQRILSRRELALVPAIGLGRPHLRREYLRLLVLHHARGPGRNALALAALPFDVHLIEVAVLHCFLGQIDLPVTRVLNAAAAVFLTLLPLVEVAYEIDVGGVGCPLAESPARLGVVQAVIVITTGEVG